jgi:hypothetical protein
MATKSSATFDESKKKVVEQMQKFYRNRIAKFGPQRGSKEACEKELEGMVSGMQAMGLSKLEAIESIAKTGDHQKDVERKREEQKAAAGGSLNKCTGPGCRKKGQNRCTGCGLEIYCSKACQRAACSGHKAACKEVRAKFLPVVLLHSEKKKMIEERRVAMNDKEVLKPKESKSMFPVCVFVFTETGDIEVKNEDNRVFGKLKRTRGQQDVYDKLRREVPRQGIEMKKGNNIYKAFYFVIDKGATEDGGHRLEMNVEKPVTMEDW